MEKRKKSRRRKLLIWLSVDVVVAAVVIGLLLYRPASYKPVIPVDAPVDENGRTVHPYLHRDLGSTFYNEVQKRRPFEIVVLQKNLNEAIVQNCWQSAEGVALSAPQVLFVPEGIILMGTADVQGAKFVVTIELDPQLDEQGRLSLTVQKFKVGAMNVTPLAKLAAKEMYEKQVEGDDIDMQNIGVRILAALLNAEPFDPVLEVDDKHVRLDKFELTEGKLVVHFVPIK